MEGDGGSKFEVPDPMTEEVSEPWFVTQVIYGMVTFISNYGWPCFIIGIISTVLFKRYGHVLESWRKKREEEQEAAFYHKNPDVLLARESAVERARQRLQEQYEQQSREYAEKQRLREEQKRKEKLDAYDAQQSGKGGKSIRAAPNNSASSAPPTKLDKKKSSLRPEFNPLMGGGGSCGWRPSARGGRAGG